MRSSAAKNKYPQKIVIGSVLKPLTDIRHYRKLAQSLLAVPDTQIFIIARGVKENLPSTPHLSFISLVSPDTSTRERLWAPFHFYFLLRRLKPQLTIVCTHELLIPAIIYKIFNGGKIIYDVQENYSLNIRSNRTYSAPIRFLLASWVSIKENLISRLINRFWLAEKCYVEQITFLSNQYNIFENKSVFSVPIQPVRFSHKSTITFLFSGTIAEENGIWEAIHFVTNLNDTDPRYQLVIIGCSHNKNLADKLAEASKNKDWLILKISSQPIDYKYIEEEIKAADIGLIPYKKQENFKEKIPTKLYEYLSAGLPVVTAIGQTWETLCKEFDACVSVDFDNYKAKDIHLILTSKTFFEKGNYNQKVLLWNYENEIIKSLGYL